MEEKLILLAQLLHQMQQPQSSVESKPSRLPRMRTLPQAVNEIKKIDPYSAITLSALRRAVKQNRIPCVHVESKTLVDLDSIVDYLSGETKKEPDNGIRKIGG